jgi:hypothetical protein
VVWGLPRFLGRGGDEGGREEVSAGIEELVELGLADIVFIVQEVVMVERVGVDVVVGDWDR